MLAKPEGLIYLATFASLWFNLLDLSVSTTEASFCIGELEVIRKG